MKLLARLTLIERKASEQKVFLTSSLFSLKMKEIKEKQKCNCRINKQENNFCKINHQKHNYVRSKSNELFSKFGQLSSENS